ncbi:MAG: hypothetical protein EOO10_09150 [Chitinophagaceae bacterium]|nr:MAG: hypothetical protein EOO10_09150 [Chitinophagaceae bacterium]
MKQWITLLTATAIFVSCSKQNLKEDLQQDKEPASVAGPSTTTGNYITAWENYSNWAKSDQGNVTVFTVQRKSDEVTSSVTNGGLVLTYAKLATTNPLYASFNNPKMLPFYFLPESERPLPQTFYFTSSVSNGVITITYRVPYTKENSPMMAGGASLQKIQFQHIILPTEFLQSRGLSASTIRNNYTYDQVMNLLNQ